MFANRFNELKIANFGVSSYSPIVYLTKVKHILDSGINFKHLVVFVDISDLYNDITHFLDSKGSVVTYWEIANKIELNNGEIANKIELNKRSAIRKFIVDNFRLTTVLYRYVN